MYTLIDTPGIFCRHFVKGGNCCWWGANWWWWWRCVSGGWVLLLKENICPRRNHFLKSSLRSATREKGNRSFNIRVIYPRSLSIPLSVSFDQTGRICKLLWVSPARVLFCRFFRAPSLILLTYSMLGKDFTKQHLEIFFLLFSPKQELTFHANCLQWRQIAWNVKSCFLGKIRKV